MLNCHLLHDGSPVQTLRVGLLQAVAVDPSPFAGFARIPKHTQDGTTRHPSVAVFGERGVEPADPCSPRDGVQAQSPNALGVVAVDGVTHRGPLLLRVSYRVTRSVAVGDVPASPLSLRAGCFPLCHPCLLISSVGITDRLTTAVLSDHLLSVVSHDGVEVGCFVHALSIGSQGSLWGNGGHLLNWHKVAQGLFVVKVQDFFFDFFLCAGLIRIH